MSEAESNIFRMNTGQKQDQKLFTFDADNESEIDLRKGNTVERDTLEKADGIDVISDDGDGNDDENEEQLRKASGNDPLMRLESQVSDVDVMRKGTVKTKKMMDDDEEGAGDDDV